MNRFNCVGILGAGKMGGTLIAGLQQHSMVRHIWAAARTEQSCAKVSAAFSIPVSTEFMEQFKETDLLLLCVRPHDIIGVCEKIREVSTLPETTPIISVAAGVSLASIERALGTAHPVIRAMPNTPCQIHRGMTVLCRGSRISDRQMDAARNIFSTIGGVVELSENMMDAATGVSASGPAFIYLIIEALVDAAVKVGLPRDIASGLVLQCVLGSAEMIRVTQRHPASLRDEVTTPGGCTIGGVMALEEGGLRATLARAVIEATRIASGLGK
jgi:pyrroline-5-carboxylate reductase